MAARPLTTRRVASLLVAALGLYAAPAAVRGQRPAGAPEGQGWIGVSFEVESDSRGRASAIRITDVMAGSPADAADVRPGDRLLAVNDLDTPGELERLAERLRLRVGDSVVMELERDGTLRRLQLTATQRPDDAPLGSRVEVAWAGGDPVEVWVRSMDSLRLEIARGSQTEVRVRTMDDGSPQQLTVVNADGPWPVRAPFEFFVFPGEAHDSLREEMADLNRTVLQLRRQVTARGAALARDGQHEAWTLVRDEEVRRLSRMIDLAVLRSTALQTAMADDARRTASLEDVVRRRRPAAVRAQDTDPGGEVFWPLTPYLLGRNRVAGAEVVDLRAELADYFPVAAGVLVLDVAPATPAALAGLVPGDVITQVDESGISSVEGLRAAVSGGPRTVALTLTRKGETLRLLLSR
jgi:hypothetical protein